MRHQKTRHKLSRDSAHRKALLANLCIEVIDHERIKTTEAKAKAVKPEIEKLITLARKGDLHARRQATSILQHPDKGVIYKLFEEIAPRYTERPGGYTRILKLGPRSSRRDRNGLPRAGLSTKLTLEYDGGPFAGWAVQPGQRTVAAEVVKALETVLRQPVDLAVAGRTDRGVHALGQVVSYDGPLPNLRERQRRAPARDRRADAPRRSPEGFSARHDATQPHATSTACSPAASRRRSSAAARCGGRTASTSTRSQACARGARRHARLHRLHAHRDLPPALHARRPPRRVGARRRHPRVPHRGRLVHAQHEPHPRRHDARGRRAAAATTSPRCSKARPAPRPATPRPRTACTWPPSATRRRARGPCRRAWPRRAPDRRRQQRRSAR